MRMHTETTEEKGFAYFIERILLKLGLVERKGYLKDGCPASYMHPYTLSEDCINKHYYYYLKELFDNTMVLWTEEEVIVEEEFFCGH
jgi:hypothetical protein